MCYALTTYLEQNFQLHIYSSTELIRLQVFKVKVIRITMERMELFQMQIPRSNPQVFGLLRSAVELRTVLLNTFGCRGPSLDHICMRPVY